MIQSGEILYGIQGLRRKDARTTIHESCRKLMLRGGMTSFTPTHVKKYFSLDSQSISIQTSI